MRTGQKLKKNPKIKIGTILDAEIIDKLKERARRENRTISALIEEAVLRNEEIDLSDREIRLKALESFRSIRFNLADEDWNTIMEEDFYEQ